MFINKTKSISVFTAAMMMSALGSMAHASDVTTKGKVSLNDFNNTSVTAVTRTSDFAAQYHSCTTGNGTSCTVTDTHRSPPKNMGNVLCMPSGMIYDITSACESLLSTGASNSCKKNSAKGFYCSGDMIAPTCDFRTGSSGTATWQWTLTAQNGTVKVDCSESGYVGYSQ